MKNLKRVLLVLVGFGSMALFSACGNQSTTGANAVGNSCGAGYIYTSSYGCLQQTASCSGTNAIINGGCQNITSLIGTGTQTGAQSCQAGYAWSSTYNSCLQQYGSCSGQYGIYNNSCVALGSATTGHTPYQGSCNSGYVQTSMGCMQQGICGVGYGFGYWGGQPYCFQATAAY